MNHLAHVLLAGRAEGLRLGAFLGDHVKGREPLREMPAEWAAGVQLHRCIDAWSDAHPAVLGLLEQLEPPWRRYGGVIFDVLFDHMLTRHWRRFGHGALVDFGAGIDRLLSKHRDTLPPRLALFSQWAAEHDLWTRYGERDVLIDIFERLARRHGRTWPLAHGIEVLDVMDRPIEDAFLKLFPDLQAQAGQERVRLYSTWSSM